jgi:hypothetical protein
MGCTDCGRKGGCDSRKHAMFAAIEEALARIYPTRRWDERDETAALESGVTRDEGIDLAGAIAKRMGTLALFRAGDSDEWCDYIYVLCLGRTPSIVEIREGQGAAGDISDLAIDDVGRGPHAPLSLAGGEDPLVDGFDDGLDERYLRVALSGLARFAGVQEVAMTLRRQQHGDGETVMITERARGGVFDPILLPRFQALVAVLAEWNLRHLDFGEILEPPDGFDPAGYPDRFGTAPVIANYLFYPQPPTTVSTVVLPALLSSST